MYNIRSLVLKVIIILQLASGSAYAANVNTNLIVTGTVTKASCDVASTSKNLVVPLGDVSPADFTSSGSVLPAKSFTVQLQNCSGESGVSVSFSGSQQDSSDNTLLALSGGTPATGLAVQLLNANSVAVPVNAPDVETLSGTSPTLTYKLQYKSTSDIVTAGDANAVLYMTFSYQ
ncbi:fimbrial protein [Klebsiella sp. CN_Kp098]|uniref:fimbrial protein n=1 Tax=unclassified Klebsiella TaxID=2608929 RepID=UPI0032B4F268